MDDPDDKNAWQKFLQVTPDKKQLARHAKKLEKATVRHAHTFLIHRWENIRDVRRHVLGWLILLGALMCAVGVQLFWNHHSYTVPAPQDNGTYAEAVVGPVETLNPIYATTPAERSATDLMFGSLFTYDQNNNLKEELARNWRVSGDGTRYAVTLRDDAVWHDGTPVTSADVVYTIETIKSENARSPLRSTWSSIEVSARNERTIVFDLPSAYAPFLHALTVGIIPEHILGDADPSRLREHQFNREPVGSGPFSFRNTQTVSIEQERDVVHLRSFPDYIHGQPKLERFQLHTYQDTEPMPDALDSGEVTAISGITAAQAHELDNDGHSVTSTPINNGVYALFNTEGNGGVDDREVRQALRAGLNRDALRAAVGDAVPALSGPLLDTQVDGISSVQQPGYNSERAANLLDDAGWTQNSDGMRTKDDTPLSLSVATIDSGNFPDVTNAMAEQWRDLGIEVNVRVVSPDEAQQNLLQPRAYDVLVYELLLGADPDVFAYWHSSQATQRGLNFTNYTSAIADDALETGRSPTDIELRNEKYHTFVSRWHRDVPAIALYQPTLRYAKQSNTNAFDPNIPLINETDRYRSVIYWSVEQGRVFSTP